MRVYNFAAGPATLPLSVLETAQRELVEYGSSGMSVMEMTHRGPDFSHILDESKASLRRLLSLSDDYEILYCQGGASQQFAMVPMNLMGSGKADYAVTGSFAKKAAQEAKMYGDVRVVSDSSDRNYSYIPKIDPASLRSDASYLHITSNNTIYGTSYRNNLPECGQLPLVADLSSNILSEVMDINRFALIYAGAQKNIGPAGLTLVIMRRELTEQLAFPQTPTMLRYKTFADNDSMYNTPPTYAIYMAGLIFAHLEKMGGVSAMQAQNERKAKMLYDALDASEFFTPLAEPSSRSLMNVTFVSPDKDNDAAFIKEAAANGLVNLKGHRVAGGMRASIYNAMPVEGVEALVQFMQDFEIRHR